MIPSFYIGNRCFTKGPLFSLVGFGVPETLDDETVGIYCKVDYDYNIQIKRGS